MSDQAMEGRRMTSTITLPFETDEDGIDALTRLTVDGREHLVVSVYVADGVTTLNLMERP